MKDKPKFLQRNLSAAILLAIYIVFVIIHLISEGFLLELQFDLMLTLIPFILVGAILDLLLSRNDTLIKGFKTLAQLFPAGILAMFFISIYFTSDNNKFVMFKYLVWLFLSLPFFIASYKKETHRTKLKFALIGTVLFAAIYLYLTTKTNELNESYGAIIYFVSYFSMLYAASGIHKLPYLGTILGAVNAALLYFFMINPVTENASIYGWDSDIVMLLEGMIMLTFVICLIIQIISVFLKKNVEESKELQSQN